MRAGELRIQTCSADERFADQRGGIYKLPMPRILGNEAAGTVVALGEGAEGVSVGDTVAVSSLSAF